MQLINEGVNEPYWIVGADIIVRCLRQQQKLRRFESKNVSHVRFLGRRRPQGNPIGATFHTVWVIFAQNFTVALTFKSQADRAGTQYSMIVRTAIFRPSAATTAAQFASCAAR